MPYHIYFRDVVLLLVQCLKAERCRFWKQWIPEGWGKLCYKSGPPNPHPTRNSNEVHWEICLPFTCSKLPYISGEAFGVQSCKLLLMKMFHFQPLPDRGEPELGDCIRKHANSGKVWTTCELCHGSDINNPVQNLTAQLKQSFWRDWTWIMVLWLSLKYFIAVLWHQGVNYGAVKNCNVKVLSFAYVQNINNAILVLG